jgi:hypothetical protein
MYLHTTTYLVADITGVAHSFLEQQRICVKQIPRPVSEHGLEAKQSTLCGWFPGLLYI